MVLWGSEFRILKLLCFVLWSHFKSYLTWILILRTKSTPYFTSVSIWFVSGNQCIHGIGAKSWQKSIVSISAAGSRGRPWASLSDKHSRPTILILSPSTTHSGQVMKRPASFLCLLNRLISDLHVFWGLSQSAPHSFQVSLSECLTLVN